MVRISPSIDFSSIQKYQDTWIPMDKLSISKYPWYITIHGIQVSMVSKYSDVRKKGYPLIPTMMVPIKRDKIVSGTNYSWSHPTFWLKLWMLEKFWCPLLFRRKNWKVVVTINMYIYLSETCLLLFTIFISTYGMLPIFFYEAAW